MELLVVIAIIGILIALLLPAVQAARESARRTQCVNQLKQLGLGVLQHHDVKKFFPSGGWGYDWVADANGGLGRNQPGGWLYSILPFIEEQSIFDMGRGLPETGALFAVHSQREKIPIATLNCPSRRSNEAYPPGCCDAKNGGGSQLKARSCYAMNFGDTQGVVTWYSSPPSRAAASGGWGWPDMSFANGISFIRSELPMRKVVDGTSKTLMLGEKYMNSDFYNRGGDPADDWSMYTGQQDDVYRSAYCGDLNDPTTCLTPTQDIPGNSGTLTQAFGSAHAGGCNFAFCDGSVHPLSYEIDAETYRRLCNRRDGKLIESSAY